MGDDASVFEAGVDVGDHDDWNDADGDADADDEGNL